MSILFDSGKAAVLDLMAVRKPAEDARRDPVRADLSESETGRGFDDALRDVQPQTDSARETRSIAAQGADRPGDESRDQTGLNDQDQPQESNQSGQHDGSDANTKSDPEGVQNASSEVSAESDDPRQAQAPSVEPEAQSAQSLAAELALVQLVNASNASGPSLQQDVSQADVLAGQLSQAALAQASSESAAQARAQGSAAQANTQVLGEQAAQQILQQGMQAETNSGDAKNESSGTAQAGVTSGQASNAAATSATFTMPDSSSGEVRLSTNVTPISQQADATKSVQALLPNVNTQSDHESLNTSRVARGLANAVQQRGGTVTLRLTPPEMGTVRIQMNITGTNVSASFHAESASAQTLLTQQLGQLRTALETQGMNVERLSVQPIAATVSSQNANQGNNDEQPTQQGQSQQQSAGDGRSRGQYSGESSGQAEQSDGQNAFAQSEAPRGFFDQLRDVVTQDV